MSLQAPTPREISTPMSRDDIQKAVLRSIETANLARDAGARLQVSADAAIFGPDSPLDSLGLVALLLDIEEALQDAGYPAVLSDERAMSQTRSPFRSVKSLVDYIEKLAQA
jgi:acyl carrier protein